ncbi:MAG: multidrug transporter ATP-binding protein [Crocinitomicaceae bacterium]|jgi:ABC-type multidrug transport system fused ATPase/permease subunit|nr:multidrug transporter ATP-binding protein [Crocinitomicaceae bacterium]
MLRPKKEKKQKVKLTKEGIRKAKGIFRYLKPYAFIFSIGWIFLVLSTSVGLVFPLMMGQLLGANSMNSTEDAIRVISLENINQVALALFLLFAAQAVFSFFRVIIFTNVTENALRDIRKDAFSRLIYMPMDFFNRNKVGELTSRLASDIVQVQETLRTTIAEFFRQIVMIVGGIVFLMLISWKLSLIMLATVPVMAIVAVVFGKFIRRLAKVAQDETAKSNVVVEESLTGISNVKAFTNELFSIQRYTKIAEEIRRLNVKSGLWRGVFASFIIFCLFGAIVFIIWQGMLMTQGTNPEMSSKDFYTFIFYTIMMGASVGSLPELYASIQKAIGSTENLMDIIQTEGEKEIMSGTSRPVITGKVSFKNIFFHYPQRPDMPVLEGVNLDAEPNETIALVGSSGAGKSTIASLLLRYFETTSGEILFDGENIRDIDIEHLRSNMALVPQEVILFGGSVRENIAYGKPEASLEEIEEAARQANAYDFISSFPDGFETQVGDRGIQLSGGQKQRIAIARALLKNPTILILDEATSALDSESEKLVQDALEHLMKGRTSFVIAHRLSTIRNADRIFVIDQGKVAEQGKHDDLIALESGIYAGLINLQMRS